MALIHEAAASNIRELVETCLDKGIHVNDVDPEHGRTALHCAAEKGHLDMVRLLLVRGANRHAIDLYGLTALELAEENGHSEVVALLEGRAPEPTLEPRRPPMTPVFVGDCVQFSCPSCGKVLQIPKQYVGAKGQCRLCGSIVEAPRPAMPFEERYAATCEEALRIVVEEALPAMRVEDESSILSNYRQIAKVWRSDELVQATEHGVKGIIQKNLRTLADRTDFEEFQILVDTQDVSAVQIIGNCSAATRPMVIRIWRSRDRYFACGGPEFITHA